jgi:hypothetical protein
MTVVGDDHILDVLGGLERAGHSLGRLEDILVVGSRLSGSLSDWMIASAN